MDDGTSSISPLDLYARLGSALAPTVVDVRRDAPAPESGRMVVSAFYCAPEEVKRWSNVTLSQPVVLYGSEGQDVSQSVARALRAAGVGRWVTRERPKVDRIACPWLIKRFIDPRSEFLYVPAEQVLEVATTMGATPYDIKGVEFGHHGDRCSFDAIVSTYDIRDPALDHLALIVRGADTSRPDLAPQCQGLLALSHGLSSRFANDHEQLKHGMIIYDTFYQWCRLQQEILGRTTVPIQSNGVIH